MITLKLDTTLSKNEYLEDLLKSLCYSASSRDVYEVVIGDVPIKLVAEFSDRIYFVDNPSSTSEVVITIPGDSLVLGNSWDKYIRYDLDHDKLIDAHEVAKRLGLFARRGESVPSEINVLTSEKESIDTE